MGELIEQIDNLVPRLADLIRDLPWPLTLVLVALAVSVKDRVSAVLTLLMVAAGTLDIRAGLPGILLGQAIGVGACYYRGAEVRRLRVRPRVIGEATSARTPRGWLHLMRQRPLSTAMVTRFMPGEHGLAFEAAGYIGRIPARFAAAAVLSWLAWLAFFAGVTFVIGAWLEQLLAFHLELPGLLIGTLIAVVIPQCLALGLTYHGRRRVRRIVARWVHREFWPTSVLYMPLLPLFAYQTLRRRSPTVFTCCNPGIGGGGGMIGESKKEILDALGPAEGHVLPSALIAAGARPEERAAEALRTLAERPDLGGFPVILKPDSGQRGFALKLARRADDVRRYFRNVRAPVLLQKYHAGPLECGVLWARYPDGPRDGRAGFIFSITRKDFPVLVGDGQRTFEELILDHPRFHTQAAVFLERFAAMRERVLARGEKLRLAEAGNHCQGTLFRDGGDLWSRELEERIDEIARRYGWHRSPSGDPDTALESGATESARTESGATSMLDIGRFDIRYESDELLRHGQGFAIVEFNGTAGESTNIYDPERSIFWMYRTLARQWGLLYELGASRRDAGARPISLLEMMLAARRHYRTRSGPALAD
jgi:membrane protein DedA with SNARE-associated domain